MSRKDPGECPTCGHEAALEWSDVGTHSGTIDVSDAEAVEMCYTPNTEEYEDIDGYLHVFDDSSEAQG